MIAGMNRPSALLTVCLVGSVLVAPSSVVATAQAKIATCHGERANIVGTKGHDYLYTDDIETGDVIATGRGRDDLTVGKANHVLICSGPGIDDVGMNRSGPGIVVDGGPGNDHLGTWRVESGVTIFGDSGDDYISGTTVGDTLDGGPGSDSIDGEHGGDVITGGVGRDLVEGGKGPDKMFGGPGADDLLGTSYVPRVKGKGDSADGGEGRDYCLAHRRRRCERTKPVPVTRPSPSPLKSGPRAG